MKEIIQGLDWKTPLKSVNLATHWRIGLGILAFASLSTVIWHFLYPNTLWFLKLWTGFATGSVMGALAGVCWQFRDPNRQEKTSGWFLLTAFSVWGAFAVISIVILAPQMRTEESIRSEIRFMTSPDILSIVVNYSTPREVTADKRHIEQLCMTANNAELFYPSHEGSLQEYGLTFFLRDGQVKHFQARIPERHPNDLSLGFSGPSHWAEIILPGGRKWIESIVTHEKDNHQTSTPQ